MGAVFDSPIPLALLWAHFASDTDLDRVWNRLGESFLAGGARLPVPEHLPGLLASKSPVDLRSLLVGSARWMVWASGYCLTMCATNCANSQPERSGVAVVKCRPVFGSTAPKMLAVPRRSYSLSCLAGFPGLLEVGGRTSAWSDTGFSSMHTTGSAGFVRLLIHRQYVFHLVDTRRPGPPRSR
jgi:hypothetical protein